MKKKTWEDFRATGLLWFVNSILHTFGWAIVFESDDAGELIKVYPARVTYRGFPTEANDEGHLKVAAYLAKNAEELNREIQD